MCHDSLVAERCDVVVVGAGVTGAATARELARRGREVVLLEQFDLLHTVGSSHGRSRIFRFAYEDRRYVELARRALRGWRELEDEFGEPLVQLTGGIDHGEPDDVAAVAATLAAAGQPHELLSPAEAEHRFPGMHFDRSTLFSPDAGRVNAERALTALLTSATQHGARIEPFTPVDRIERNGARVTVHTAGDAESDDPGLLYDAACVVIAAGAWATRLVGELVTLPPLAVTEESVVHFTPTDAAAEWPSFVHHRTPDHKSYGLLTPDEGVKVGLHHEGRPLTDPDDRRFHLDHRRQAELVDYVREWLPGVDPEPASETTCLYTSTPEHHFVIDRVGPIVVASPCSGHGFKFGPATGSLVADLVDNASQDPLLRFPLSSS